MNGIQERIIAASPIMTNNERLSSLSVDGLKALNNVILKFENSTLPKWLNHNLLTRMINKKENKNDNFDECKKILNIFMFRTTINGTEFLLNYESNKDNKSNEGENKNKNDEEEEENQLIGHWVCETDLVANPFFDEKFEHFKNNSFDFNYLNEVSNCSISVLSHRIVNNEKQYFYYVHSPSFSVFFWEGAVSKAESLAIRNYAYYLRTIPNCMPEKPSTLRGFQSNKLEDYQIDGVKWMIEKWIGNNQFVIGDEKGMGKTVQSLMFLNFINERSSFHGPFLILVHNDQLQKWKNEIEEWTELYAIVYHGNDAIRSIIRKYGFPSINENGDAISDSFSFNILLTTYEIYEKDFIKLSKIQFQITILDNPYKLTSFFTDLKMQNSVQMSLSESLPSLSKSFQIALIQDFLDATNKQIIQIFKYFQPNVTWSENLFSKLYYPRAKQLFNSIILCRSRRFFNHKKNINNVQEFVAFVSPTPVQLFLSHLIQTHELQRICSSSNNQYFNSVSNETLLQLLFNHPFLIEGVESYLSTTITCDKRSRLIGVSSKFIVLDRILQSSIRGKIRIVVYAKSKKLFQLIEEVMKMSMWKYFMVNESIEPLEIHGLLDYFNSSSNDDVFILLSSIPLNNIQLSSISIILIFEHEWDPQKELSESLVLFNNKDQNYVEKMPPKYVFHIVTFGTYDHEKFLEIYNRRIKCHSLFVHGDEGFDDQIMTISPPDNATLSTPPNEDVMTELGKIAQIVPIHYRKTLKKSKIFTTDNLIANNIPVLENEASSTQSSLRQKKTNNEICIPFEKSDIVPIIRQLMRYGFGRWSEISKAVEGHGISQIYEFSCCVVILAFRCFSVCTIPEYPILITQLNIAVPDFSINILFCSDPKFWGMVFNENHVFNDTLGQLRKYKEEIETYSKVMLNTLEIRCIYQLWCSHFGKDFFAFNKLPPPKDIATDQKIFKQLTNHEEIDIFNSRINEIILLMKSDLIVENKFNADQSLAWWCEGEFRQVLRVFKDIGFNLKNPTGFHAKTGLLSKDTAEVKRFANGVKSSILTGKNIYPSVYKIQYAPEFIQKNLFFFEWANLKQIDCLEVKFSELLNSNIQYIVENFEKISFDLPSGWNRRDIKKLLLLLLKYGVSKFYDILNEKSFGLPKLEMESDGVSIFENISQFSLFIQQTKDIAYCSSII